jgi:O-antigen/teichoic acid export membrane protein
MKAEQGVVKLGGALARRYRGLVRDLVDERLFNNVVWLYLSYVLMAAVGAVFWIIAARVTPPEFVGRSVFILNTAEALVLCSLLGINSTVVREWRGMEEKGKYFGSALVVVSAVSLIMLFPIFYIIGPQYGWGVIAGVVCFVLLLDMNEVFNSVYIAELKPKLLVIRNAAYAVFKVGMVYFVVSASPSNGIVYTAILAVALGICVFFVCTRKSGLFPTGISLRGLKALWGSWRFSLSNYVVHSLDHLWLVLLPVLVILWVGEAVGSYFYIPWYMSCLLVLAANAIAMSLFAEGSVNEVDLDVNVAKITRLVKYALVPLALLGALAGRYLLHLFGGDYYREGSAVLVLLFLASIPFMVVSIYKAVCRVKRLILEIVLVWTALMAFTLIPSFVLVPSHGVVALGYSWLGANVLVASYALLRLKRMGISL